MPVTCAPSTAEINPFVELKTLNKACPPEAWARELPVLQRDGRVVSDVIRRDIQRSRDTDVLDVEVKRRLCTALHVAETAVAREGFLVQAAQDPDRWLVVDGTAEVAALTAHIVASVRERLGDAPAGRR